MAWVVTGSRGRTWRGADWIVRNAFELVVPALRLAGGSALGARCEEALAEGTHRLDLCDLLDHEPNSEFWLRALDASLSALEAEGNADWNEPQLWATLAGGIKRLATLARCDGNELVIALAASAPRDLME